MRIEREHAAAVVIDYQEKLIPAMDRKETLIENSSILLAGSSRAGHPHGVHPAVHKGAGQYSEGADPGCGDGRICGEDPLQRLAGCGQQPSLDTGEKVHYPLRRGVPYLRAADP